MMQYADAKKKYLDRAATQDSTAENVLGEIALRALGMKRDEAEAFSWFQKSAEHGNRAGMSNLAFMYQEGYGTAPNLQMAQQWYDKAAALHDKRAELTLPLVMKAMEQQDSKQPISDASIVGDTPAPCNEQVRDLVEQAETQMPIETAPYAAFPEANGEKSHRQGFAKEDLAIELINEYAWAGCFKKAGRLLTSYQIYGRQFHDMALADVAHAMVHFGQQERAVVLAYLADNGWAQERILREVTTNLALEGNYDLCIDYATSLVKSDQFQVTYNFYYPIEALAKKGDDKGLIKIATAETIRGKLGVDGNLLLAEALYRLKDRNGAMHALRTAQSHVPEFAQRYITPFDNPLSRVARVQSKLEPQNVDATMDGVTDKSNNFRIEVLISAVIVSTDKKRRLHWLKEIDRLSPEIVEEQKNLHYDNLIFVCNGAQAYAFLGMYERALKLMQERGCNKSAKPEEQVSRNLESIFRIAATKGDIIKAMKLMPRQQKADTEFHPETLPIIYGLVRIGHYDDALFYFKQVEKTKGWGLRHVDDMIAEIEKIAGRDFPVQDWIVEIDANSDKLQLNRWDILRTVFAQCAKTKGYDAAQALTHKFNGNDLAAAQIGTAEGLRGFIPGPTYELYRFY